MRTPERNQKMEKPLNAFKGNQNWGPIRITAAASLPERLGKQLRHAFTWLVLFLRNGGSPPSLIAWPDLPSRRSVLHKLCHELGWELTNQPRKSSVGMMRFEDTTEKRSPLPDWMHQMPAPILNQYCSDIRKQTLEKNHMMAFGYGMSVNPLTHSGLLVIKSDANAKHDGRIVQGPLSIDQIHASSVYQRVIRNQDEFGCWLDLRVVVMDGIMPLLYLKFKNENERFTNKTASVRLAKTADYLSSEEMKGIAQVMSLHQTDAAELDVLRDADDGRIYVVDINPTPWGPPEKLDKSSQKEAIERMADRLKKAIHQARI